MQGQWNLSYKTIGHTLKIGVLMLNFVLFRNSVPFRLFENYVHWKAYQKKKKRHREREREGKKRRRFQADEGREGGKKRRKYIEVCVMLDLIFLVQLSFIKLVCFTPSSSVRRWRWSLLGICYLSTYAKIVKNWAYLYCVLRWGGSEIVELRFCCLFPYAKIVKTEYNYAVFCVEVAQKL